MATLYYSGSFTVPGSTGNYSITDCPFKPDAIIFIGANITTENTVVTGRKACFWGITKTNYGDISPESWCHSWIPIVGSAADKVPIICMNESLGIDFKASLVSLNDDGFTLNFTTVGTGKVFWMAITSTNIVGLQHTDPSTLSLGWKPGTDLTINATDVGADGLIGPLNYHLFAIGGMSWRGDAWFAVDRTEPVGGHIGQAYYPSYTQRNCDHTLVDLPEGYTSRGYDFIGPFMKFGWIYSKPTGVDLTDFYKTGYNLQWQEWLAWEEDSNLAFVSLSNTLDAEVDNYFWHHAVGPATAAIFRGTGTNDVGGGSLISGGHGFAVRDLNNPLGSGVVSHYSIFTREHNGGETIISTNRIIDSVNGSNYHAFTVDFDTHTPPDAFDNYKCVLKTVSNTNNAGPFMMQAFQGNRIGPIDLSKIRYRNYEPNTQGL